MLPIVPNQRDSDVIGEYAEKKVVWETRQIHSAQAARIKMMVLWVGSCWFQGEA
jgi:hypothetical protein